MFGTCLFLMSGKLNSVVTTAKSNLLSWNKIVLREHDTGGHSWVNDSLNSQARSRSLPWIVELLVLLNENQYFGTRFVSREHNFIRDVYAGSRRGEPGGVWLHVCMYMCIYVCYCVNSSPSVLFISHPVIHSQSLFQDSSPRDFHLVIPWTFPISQPCSNAL